jgi:hypothetical protein
VALAVIIALWVETWLHQHQYVYEYNLSFQNLLLWKKEARKGLLENQVFGNYLQEQFSCCHASKTECYTGLQNYNQKCRRQRNMRTFQHEGSATVTVDASLQVLRDRKNVSMHSCSI